MFGYLFIIAAICGLSIYFLYSSIDKWYFKIPVFIIVLIIGLFASTTLGFFIDEKDGMLSYLANSPFFLIIGCSVGAFKARKIKTTKYNN